MSIHTIHSLMQTNAPLEATNDNSKLDAPMIDWQLRTVIHEGSLSIRIINDGPEFTGKGGFFQEVAVWHTADDCQWAHFVGPFAKINALRFMTAYENERRQAVIDKLITNGRA